MEKSTQRVDLVNQLFGIIEDILDSANEDSSFYEFKEINSSWAKYTIIHKETQLKCTILIDPKNIFTFRTISDFFNQKIKTTDSLEIAKYFGIYIKQCKSILEIDNRAKYLGNNKYYKSYFGTIKDQYSFITKKEASIIKNLFKTYIDEFELLLKNIQLLLNSEPIFGKDSPKFNNIKFQKDLSNKVFNKIQIDYERNCAKDGKLKNDEKLINAINELITTIKISEEAKNRTSSKLTRKEWISYLFSSISIMLNCIQNQVLHTYVKNMIHLFLHELFELILKGW